MLTNSINSRLIIYRRNLTFWGFKIVVDFPTQTNSFTNVWNTYSQPVSAISQPIMFLLRHHRFEDKLVYEEMLTKAIS